MKYKIYNNELSNIDNEQKAYFLGLIYADGCITHRKGKECHFRISLTDKELIDQLYNQFNFLNYETFDFGKYNKNQKIQYGLRKSCKELYNDLYKNGVFPRKSGENCHLLKIPNINTELISHFIRGYFDGDGSISISKSRPNIRRAEICSTSKEFLLQIKNYLELNNIPTKFREKLLKRQLPLYVIEWVNFSQISTLKELFYKDATIYLKRKKNLFEYQLIDKKEKNPDCPNCLNINCCIKHSKRTMKYGLAFRFKCLKCDKRFTKTEAQLKLEELLEKPEEVNQQPN